MTKFIIALISLSAVQAFACPDLAGNYTCTYSDGTSEATEFTQSTTNGVTTYNLGVQEVIADGAPHPVKEEDIDGSYTATCTTDAVSTVLTGDILDAGQAVAKVNVTLKVQKNRTGLAIGQTGEISVGADVIPVDDSATCTKN
jgi:hypothetical protein